MSGPISVKTVVNFDEQFDLAKVIIKEEMQKEFAKTSSVVKNALKEQTDSSVKGSVRTLCFPATTSIDNTFPKPVGTVINSSIESSSEAISKRSCHSIIDRTVDTTTKNAINSSVDTSVNSTQSYFTMAYEYIQSIFG